MSQSETLLEIHKLIAWLDKNKGTNNVQNVGKVLDSLAIHSERFGDIVSEAYADVNFLEDNYKLAVAEFRKNYTGGVAKGEIEAEVEFAEMKRDWTEAKNIYKKLATKLDRIDKILESHRQTISVVVKTGLKNMSGV